MKNKLVNYFKENWRELSLLTLTVSFVMQMYLFAEKRPEGSFLQSLALISIIAHAVLICLLFRVLWRGKWSRRAAERMQRVFARLQKFIEKFADKVGFKKSKNSVLAGKTTIKFNKSYGEHVSERQSVKRQPKWKQMADDRGRMRYLYRNMITGKIRNGATIYSFATPSEIDREQKNTPEEQELFDIYIRCRYDDRISPDREQIKKLKDDLNIT